MTSHAHRLELNERRNDSSAAAKRSGQRPRSHMRRHCCTSPTVEGHHYPARTCRHHGVTPIWKDQLRQHSACLPPFSQYVFSCHKQDQAYACALGARTGAANADSSLRHATCQMLVLSRRRNRAVSGLSTHSCQGQCELSCPVLSCSIGCSRVLGRGPVIMTHGWLHLALTKLD